MDIVGIQVGPVEKQGVIVDQESMVFGGQFLHLGDKLALNHLVLVGSERELGRCQTEVEHRIGSSITESLDHGSEIRLEVLAIEVPAPRVGIVGTECQNQDFRLGILRSRIIFCIPVRGFSLARHGGTTHAIVQYSVVTTQELIEKSRPRCLARRTAVTVGDTVSHSHDFHGHAGVVDAVGRLTEGDARKGQEGRC